MKKIEITFPIDMQGQSKDLAKWLLNQDIVESNQMTTISKNVDNSMAAAEILQIILASKVIIELIKCLNTYIKANRIKSSIKVKVDNKEFSMDFENLKNEDKLLLEIKEILSHDKE